jgi:ubiquinol-cytochrome c reductase cytochrome b subunit
LAVHLALVWHQKHTQFPGPGRTEANVIGEPVWPSFAMKSTGLFFMTTAVITALGALFDINAVWLYGPYDTAAATSFSQPDWYIGFLEGSLRLFPPWETRVGGYTINNIFYSGVVVPSLIFGGLFAVPWIERWLTGDTSEHHLLDRPRDAADRTAIGVASITAVSVLFLGGAQDVIADTLQMPVIRVTHVLQALLLIGPPVAWYVTRRSCLALQLRPGADHSERSATFVRTASGGYVEAGSAVPDGAGGPGDPVEAGAER